MKKFNSLGITTIVTDDKLKIEVSIKGLINGFERSPNNYDEMAVIKGKKQAFAEWVAQEILNKQDPETGDNLAMKMFDEAFNTVFEGDYVNDEIFTYGRNDD